jgi:hypothetical protein
MGETGVVDHLSLPRIVAALEGIERASWKGVPAAEVLGMRGQGMTYKQIAEHFGKRVEVIRMIVARAVRASHQQGREATA